MIHPILLSIIAAILYLSIKDSNIRLLPANIVMPALLLILFAPGLLLTIPAANNKGLLMSGQSSVASSIVHAGVVGLLFAILLKKFPQFY